MFFESMKEFTFKGFAEHMHRVKEFPFFADVLQLIGKAQVGSRNQSVDVWMEH